eukprot:12042239-Ditylum_brightwellii.AAC.1
MSTLSLFLLLASSYEVADNQKWQKKSKGGNSMGVYSCSISSTDMISVVLELQKVQIMIGKQCQCLLPGSYKLWHLHLQFQSRI